MFRLDLTPEQAAALVHELDALVAKGLSHPSIAAPIAAGLESGAVYLAEEYAVGDSLDVVLRERGPLQFEAAVYMIERLAEAIDHAADRGVHHGSLHPRDLILSPDGVRITGLGISSALSRVGARLPTRPPYSLSGSPADDVYSLAAMAFEAMSGRRLSAAHLEEFGREHGPELLAAFTAATASAPERRPARAGEFAALISAAADAGPKPGPTPEMEPDIAAGPGLSPGDVAADETAVGPGFSPAEVDLDSIVTDRFTDLPPPVVEPSPFPETWRAQPPRPLQAEPATGHSQGRRTNTILLSVLFVLAAALIGYAAIYFTRPRPDAQAAAATETKPPVTETVVDVPPPTSPAPPVGSAPAIRGTASASDQPPAPAPAPSRLASGAGARTKTSPASGNLVIRSTPENADVLVNGQARGKTPLTVRDLPLGSYTIRVARDGYATAQRQVRLTARQSTAAMTLTLRSTPVKSGSAQGSINVQSRPAGARVYVNDKLIGSTPLVMPGLPAGPVTVRIEMDGYRTWATTVGVSAGEQTRVGASLDRR